MVVICIKNGAAVRKYFFQAVPVPVKRDVKDGDSRIADIRQLLKKGNIAFDATDKPGIRTGFMKPQLVQGADTIGISVKDINIFHQSCSRNRACV